MMKYYYLGRENSPRRKSCPIPTKPFQAIRAKDAHGNMMYFPVVLDKWDKDMRKIFVQGVGRVNLLKRKTYEIPLYDGDPSKWFEYIEMYGYRCLYYSINGKEIGHDCCDLREVREFFSICKSDPEKYPAFVDSYKRMNEIQERVIMETIKSDKNMDQMLFRPCHSIMGFSFPYCADVIGDDDRLANYWIEFRKSGVPFNDRMKSDFWDQVHHEIHTDNNVFPTSMKDRIKKVYGDECCAIYEQLINNEK